MTVTHAPPSSGVIVAMATVSPTCPGMCPCLSFAEHELRSAGLYSGSAARRTSMPYATATPASLC